MLTFALNTWRNGSTRVPDQRRRYSKNTVDGAILVGQKKESSTITDIRFKMTTVFKALRVFKRIVFGYLTLVFIKVLLRLRKVRQQTDLTGYPAVPHSFSILGIVPHLLLNLHRIPDTRLEWYQLVSSIQQRRVESVTISPPIWVAAPLVCTKDPKVIKYILKDRFDNFVKTDDVKDVLSGFLSKGIFAFNHGVTFVYSCFIPHFILVATL